METNSHEPWGCARCQQEFPTQDAAKAHFYDTHRRPLGEAQDDVRAFHEACGLAVRDRPTAPGADLLILRRNLVREEAKELVEALEMGGPPDLASMAHVAKEMADVIVVVLGTAVSFGISMDEVWREVHYSNMAKRGPDGKVLRREDGKILKPPGWMPPDLGVVIRRQTEAGRA